MGKGEGEVGTNPAQMKSSGGAQSNTYRQERTAVCESGAKGSGRPLRTTPAPEVQYTVWQAPALSSTPATENRMGARQDDW